MFTTRSFYLLVVMALLVVTACAPQATSEPVATSVPAQPITLRLAVADPEGRPSDPYVREFIQQVNTLSSGSITIEPIWNAAADTTPSSEPGVIKLLKDGQYDLGLAGARAFDTQGITSFQALQAPFLITNDALSKAVATSDIAIQMLASLSSTEVVGLTLWPEDLRHPFSTTPNKPILAPEDFAGMNIRAVPSDVTYTLIETFGATPMLGDSGYQGSESGLSQVVFITRTPTATGNVVFFAKFQVLFAYGGGIVMASETQVAAFEAAAQPVFARIEQDPFNAEMIAAIRELKANTQASAGAGACGTNTETWSEGLLPNGTWTVELSIEDLAGMGVSQSDAAGWAGVGTFTFQDGKAVYRHQGEIDYECEATYEVVQDFVRITYPNDQGACTGVVEDLQWRLDKDGLHFQLIAAQNVPFLEDKAAYEAKPWQKIADQ